MKIWIASDCSRGGYYSIPDEGLTPIEIAYKFGRAEFGEIISIWNDDNTERLPDAEVYWDSQFRKYRLNN